VLAPRIEKVISAREGKVHLAKVDIDDISDLALEYGVSITRICQGVDFDLLIMDSSIENLADISESQILPNEQKDQ